MSAARVALSKVILVCFIHVSLVLMFPRLQPWVVSGFEPKQV
jgi:hypothetical protein